MENSANLKQGAHIHQPTAGSVPHACAQSYHAASGSHRQLFRSYWGPLAWQSRWINKRWKPTSQKPLTAEVSAKLSIKHQLHTTHVLAGNGRAVLPRHARGRWITSYQLKTSGTNMHQSTAWPLPHACAQWDHAGSGSYEQLFHQHGIALGQWQGKTRVQKTLSCRGESFKCQLHATHVEDVGS